MGARPLHLFERAFGIPRLDVDAAHRILHDRDVEPLTPRVEHGALDAVVGREPRHEQAVDLPLAEKLAELRVLKAGVPLAVRVLALVYAVVLEVAGAGTKRGSQA